METQQDRQAGFTLLEILLVFIIIVVISGVAVLAVGDRRHNSLNNQAQKLQATLQWLSEEAVFQQKPQGLEILKQGYQHLVWDYLGRKWITADSRRSTTILPDYIQIEPQPTTEKEAEKERFPTVIFYPDQNFESFSITLSINQKNEKLIVRGKRFKGIEIVRF